MTASTQRNAKRYLFGNPCDWKTQSYEMRHSLVTILLMFFAMKVYWLFAALLAIRFGSNFGGISLSRRFAGGVVGHSISATFGLICAAITDVVQRHVCRRQHVLALAVRA